MRLSGAGPLLLALIFAESWTVLRAQTIVPLVFDNQAGYDLSEVFIHFLPGSDSPIIGSFFDINNTSQTLQLSTPYQLANLVGHSGHPSIPAGSPAVFLEQFSGRIYISLGTQGLILPPDNPGYSPAAATPSDPNFLTRFQYIEPTIANGQFTGDLSYIDFVAMSFSLQIVGANPGQAQNNPQTSQNTYQLANAVKATVAPGQSAILPPSVTNTGNPVADPNFARVIGPNIDGNPFNTFADYIDSLNGQTVKIGGIFVGTGPQNASTTPEQRFQTYDFTATFSGTVAGGGSVTFTSNPNSGDSSVPFFPGHIPTGAGVGNQVTITIHYSDLNAITGIYGNSPSYTVTSPNGTLVTGGLTNDVYGRAVGDLLAGFSLGFIGSPVTMTQGGTPIGQMYSAEWWGTVGSDIPAFLPDGTPIINATTPAAKGIYFRNAQPNVTDPTKPRYHQYADALVGPNHLIPLTPGYGFPLQDRLGANLIVLDFNVSGANPNAYMSVVLNPDLGAPLNTAIWDGGALTGNWATAANWNPDAVPTAGAIIQFAGSNQTTVTVGGTRTIGGLFFNLGASPFTIGTAPGEGTLALDGNIINFSTALQTVHANLALSGERSIVTPSGGNLTLSGTIDLGNLDPTELILAGQTGRTITLSGDITGTGTLTKTGLSSLLLSGTNTFSGGFSLNGGTVTLASSSALGTGTLTFNGGQLNSSGGPLTLANALIFSGSTTSTAGFGGTNPFTFTGPVTIEGSTQLRNTADLTFNGILAATGTGAANYILTKSGTGTLTFGGISPDTFPGTVRVNRGTLDLAKSSGPALPGNLIIGDGIGSTPNATARLLANNQLTTSSQITLNSNGIFNTQTFNTSLNRLTLTGGSVTGTGTLTFAGSDPIVLFSGTGSAASTISANLQLDALTAFNINPSDAPVELTVTGNLSGSSGLAKNNGGTLALTGDNSGFTGTITLGGGTLATGTAPTSSLTNATLTLAGGTLSPGGLNTLSTTVVQNLTPNSGGFLFDLAAASSDQVTIGNEILGTLLTTTFFFNDAGFLTTPANTPLTFTLLTTTIPAEIAKLPLANLSFSSVNIPGLTGTFSIVGSDLRFEARHGVTDSWSTTAASGLWGTAANWTSGSVPAPGTDLTFTTSTSTSLTLEADRQTGSVTVNAGGDAFSFNGNNLILGGDFTNHAAATQTINSGLILNGNRTVSNTDPGGSALIQGNISLSNTALPNTLTLSGPGTTTVHGVIADAVSSIIAPAPGNLLIAGPGTVNLTAANTFTGSVTLSGGTLNISSDGNLGSSGLLAVAPTNQLIFDGGTLRFTAAVTLGLVRNVVFNQQALLDTNGFDVTIQGTMTGPAGLQKSGAGTLTLATSTSNSTFSGPILISAGTLSASTLGSFGQTPSLTVASGATLQLTSNLAFTKSAFSLAGSGVGGVGALNITSGNVSIASTTSLTGDATIAAQNATSLALGAVSLGSHTLTLAPANNSVTITLGGPISGSGGLTLNSPTTGIVRMTGTHTYSGPTTLTSGTLLLTNTNNLKAATGTITVGSAATLNLSNIPANPADTGIVLTNPFTFSGGTLLNSVGQNTLSGAINLTTAATSLNIQVGNLSLSGNLTGTQNLILTQGTLILSGTNSAWTGDFTANSGSSVTASGTNALGTGTATIQNGASLLLSGGVSLGNSTLNLSGPGLGGSGALQNVAGNNTISSSVNLGPGSTIQLDSGNLTLIGTTAFGSNALAVSGANATSTLTFTQPITGVAGSSLNLNSGTTILSSANPGYSGVININGTSPAAGATLVTLDNNPLPNATLLLNQHGTLSPGGAGTLQTLTLSTLGQINGTLFFDLGPASNSDRIVLTTGAPSFGPTAAFHFNDAGYAGPGTYTLFQSPGTPAGFATLTFTTNIPGLTPQTGTFSVSPTNHLIFTTTSGGSTAATWDGGAGTGLWGEADNWDPNGIPDLGATLTFAGAVQPIVDTQVARVTGSITFDNTAAPFTLNNNSLTVGGNLTNNSANLQTINSTLIFTGDRTLDAASGAFALNAIQINPATSTPHTLTLAGAHDITVSGPISNQGNAPGNLLVTNTATVTLNGTNTYSGSTTIGPGATLAAASLGDGSATNTLVLNGGTFSATADLTSPTARGVQITAPGSIIQTNAHTVTLNGNVSGNGAWTKLGTGTLVLAGSNTFTGAVSVAEGTLNLRHNNALGASTAGLTVSSGAALELQNNITVANEPLTLNGTGISGNGALRNVSGTNTFSGPINVATTSSIRTETGSTLTLAGQVTLATTDLTLHTLGTLQSTSGIIGNGDLTLTGTGTVSLNGTNSFTGTANVAGATLRSGDLPNALVTLDSGAYGPGAAGQIAHVTLQGIALNGGDLLFDLGPNNTSDRILIGTGTATLTAHTVFNFSSAAYQPGTFTLLSGTGVNLLNPNDFSFTTTIPDLSGSFSIVGTDLRFTSVLATVSTWDGGAGTGFWADSDNWDPAGLPNPGNTLIFSGNVQTTIDTQANRTTGAITFDSEAAAFTLNNNTLTVGGAITNQSSETHTINSALTFNHNAVLNAADGNFLINGNIALSNNTTPRTLSVTGPGNTTLTGIISNGPSAPTGNLLKSGTGTLALTAANTYSGTTTLAGGILQISAANNLGNGSATNSLIFAGGTLRLTAAIPDLGRTISLQSNGTLDTGIFNLAINDIISGPGGFTKLGTGTLTLNAANTYSGLTHLQAGRIELTHPNALGSTADGTLVESGATLALNNVAIGNETLLLNGSGQGSTLGALRSTGNSSWAGAILLGSDTTIVVVGTEFTASGNIFLGPQTLTAHLFAPATFSGVISGSGGLIHSGGSTLTLTGNNTYTGITTISGGNLELGNGGTSGSIAGPIVNNGFLNVNRSDTVLLPGIISGTGTLNQSGSGTLILTGNNTYTGSTNINSGTLQIGNGGTSGSIAGNLLNNSALIFNRSDTHTPAGMIFGSGSLTQAGSGTLLLNADNFYTGGTTVANGILRITSNLALGFGAVTVNPGALLELGGSITLPTFNNLTLAGTLQSNGGNNAYEANLVLPGNATLANLVPGTTFTLGTAAFTEFIDTGAAGFTLTFNGPGDFLLNSAITGPGGIGNPGPGQVIKNGSGTLTFFADENFYTGTTTINDGTLVLDTLTGLNGAIKGTSILIGDGLGAVQSAVLRLGDSVAPIANEMINDTAAISILADGLFHLNGQTETIGSLQFTGGTLLTGTGGSLRFDPGTPAGGILTNPSASTALIDATGGTLHLNGNRTFTIAAGGGAADLEIRGNITDGLVPSGLTKQGTGTLLLNGDSTYTGDTSILAGQLQLEGSLASPTVTVANGATLGGSGTLLGNLIVQAGGLLSPGSSPGILTIGTLTLNPGSATLFEINGLTPGTQHDQVIVTGTASLAGSAQFLFGGGFTPSDGDTFTLIQAASLTGTYDTFTSNLGAIFALDLLYNPTSFQLAIRVTQLDYTTFALNQNQFNVAANLDTFSRTGQMPELISFLNSLDAPNLANALQQLSPDQLGLMNTLATQYNRAQSRNLFHRLSEWRISGGGIAGTVSTSSLRLLDWTSQPVYAGTRLRDYTPVSLDSIQSPGWSLFASGTGQFGDIQADGNGSGYDFKTGGMTVGFDRKITRLGDGDLIGGFYAGYAGSDAKLDNAGGRVEANGGKFGVFGSWINEGLYVNAQAGGGLTDYDTRRNVLGQRQTGSTTGYEFIGDLLIGHEWQKGSWRFGPELGLAYSYVGIDRFTERGGLAPLQIQEQNNHSLQSRLGLQASYEWTGKNDWWLRPSARASWGHEFLDPAPSIDSRFASGAGGIFSVNPTQIGRDTAIAGLNLTFGQGTRWSGWIGYEAEVGDRLTIHTLNAGANFKF